MHCMSAEDPRQHSGELHNSNTAGCSFVPFSTKHMSTQLRAMGWNHLAFRRCMCHMLVVTSAPTVKQSFSDWSGALPSTKRQVHELEPVKMFTWAMRIVRN